MSVYTPVYPPDCIVQAKLNKNVTTPEDFAIGYRDPISPWLDPTQAVEMRFLDHFKTGEVLEAVDARRHLREVPLAYRGNERLISYRIRAGENQFWFRCTDVEEASIQQSSNQAK